MRFLRTKRKFVIQPVSSSQMRLGDWTASPELVASAQKLFATQEFRTIMSILRNESPASFGLGPGASHDDQIGHAYKIHGYNLCINTLESLAQHNKKLTPLEATFAPEEPQLRSEPLV